MYSNWGNEEEIFLTPLISNAFSRLQSYVLKRIFITEILTLLYLTST